MIEIETEEKVREDPSNILSWKTLSSIDNSFPNIRSNTVSFFYQDALWLIGGRGVGHMNETWTFSFNNHVK